MEKCTINNLHDIFNKYKVSKCGSREKADLLSHFNEYSSFIDAQVKASEKTTRRRSNKNA
jgi:hypothetical protein